MIKNTTVAQGACSTEEIGADIDVTNYRHAPKWRLRRGGTKSIVIGP
jgi:hypothetical protein